MQTTQQGDLLSMAGMPPFIGFYAKLLILQQVISSGMITVAIIMLVCINATIEPMAIDKIASTINKSDQ
jgi:formate hydrogenlyase subunit 3/multisubunit Na+/H+ antiporter MnhD subunit